MKREINFNVLEIMCVFLAILFKYLINIGISKTYLYVYLSFLIFIVLLILLVKKLKKYELLMVFLLLLISAFYVIFYSDVNFLISFLLGILCIRKNEENFIKLFFRFSIFLFAITIFCNIINLLPDYNMYRITDGHYVVRHSLGFRHPNEVFLFFLPIALSGYYLYADKKKFYLFVFLVATVLFYYSNCRTGYFVTLLLILFGLISRKSNKISLYKFIPYLFLVFTFLSILLAVFYGTDTNNSISSMLSGRPYYWNHYIETNNLISFLGNNRIDGYFLDNFYIYLLVQLGLFGFMIYWYIYYKSLKKMIYNHKYMIIILIFLIYGLFETNVIIGSIQFLFAIQIKHFIISKKEIMEEYSEK